MKNLLKWLYETFSPCVHIRLSRACRDEDGDYQRCLDCGKRLKSKIQFDTRRPPWGPWARADQPTQATVNDYLETLEIGSKLKK